MPTAELSPPQGTTHDLLERLFAYVARVDADWARKLAPASEHELHRLYELAGLDTAGLSLPESYRVWALAAGADDGGLLSETLRAWVSVADLIEFHGDLHRFEPQLIQPRLPVVMNKKIGDEYSLDLREPGTEPTVRETSGGEDLGFFSTSWEALLFQCAISRCERQRFEHLRIYGSAAAGVKQALTKTAHSEASELVSEALLGHDLQLPWTNDARHVHGLGEDVSVLVNIGSNGAAPFVVVGSNTKRMRELGDALAAAVGAAPAAHDQWR